MRLVTHSRKLIAFMMVFLLLLGPVLLVGCGRETTRSLGTLDNPRLDSGTISGLQEGGVRVFLGVPYAAPPVGDLRWREPQPVHPWTEVRPCVKYGASCPQPRQDWTGQLDVGEMSEDCLYLNVWTPARSQEDRLPVMVWIHGGAFRTGSGSLPIYKGIRLAGKGVVVVTINYRLGPFGFLAHPLLSAESPSGVSGNYGLLDQLEALRWVKKNIEAFGGDPDNVTVFGESAGGMSILYLMTSPMSEGLFRRAVVESGPLLDLGLPVNMMPTLREAEKTGEQISKELGCDQEEDQLSALRAVAPEKLLEASSRGNSLFGPIGLSPNVDGYLLPERPVKVFSEGRQLPVPLLTGINADEGTIFAPEISLEQYRLMASYLYGGLMEEVLARYPATEPSEVKPALNRLITELGFASSARFTSECMEKAGAPAYLYHFTRVPADPRLQALGSFHGLEIMYVFGTLDEVEMKGLTGEDRSLCEAMMSYWTNFARTGDPNGPGLEEWPVFRSESADYLELGLDIKGGSGFFASAYELIRKISDYAP